MDRLSFLKRFALGIAAIAASPKLLAEATKEAPLPKEPESAPKDLVLTDLYKSDKNTTLCCCIESFDLPGSKPAKVQLFNNGTFKNFVSDNGGGRGSIKVEYSPSFHGDVLRPFFIKGIRFSSNNLRDLSIVEFQKTDAAGCMTLWPMHVQHFFTPEMESYDVVEISTHKIMDFTAQMSLFIKPGQKLFIELMPDEDLKIETRF